MITISLPDSATRALDPASTAADLAAFISPSLAKRTVAAVVNGQVSDLSAPLPDVAAVELMSRDEGPGADRAWRAGGRRTQRDHPPPWKRQDPGPISGRGGASAGHGGAIPRSARVMVALGQVASSSPVPRLFEV